VKNRWTTAVLFLAATFILLGTDKCLPQICKVDPNVPGCPVPKPVCDQVTTYGCWKSTVFPGGGLWWEWVPNIPPAASPSIIPSEPAPSTPPSVQPTPPPSAGPTAEPVPSLPPPTAPPSVVPPTPPSAEPSVGPSVEPSAPPTPAPCWPRTVVPIRKAVGKCPKGWTTVGEAHPEFCIPRSSCPLDTNCHASVGCQGCAEIIASDLDATPSIQPGPNGLIWHGQKHGWMDALCRRSLNGSDIVHDGVDQHGSWEYYNACRPAEPVCGTAPSPTPPAPSAPPTAPAPTPTPGGEFNCNGEFEPADCSAYQHVQVVGGPGLMGKCVAGSKCAFNSSPKVEDERCERGAVIPGKCVIVPPIAYLPGWTVSPEGEASGDSENYNYIGHVKPRRGGTHYVTVCMNGAKRCANLCKAGDDPKAGKCVVMVSPGCCTLAVAVGAAGEEE
jgi:hypothetical protein